MRVWRLRNLDCISKIFVHQERLAVETSDRLWWLWVTVKGKWNSQHLGAVGSKYTSMIMIILPTPFMLLSCFNMAFVSSGQSSIFFHIQLICDDCDWWRTTPQVPVHVWCEVGWDFRAFLISESRAWLFLGVTSHCILKKDMNEWHACIWELGRFGRAMTLFDMGFKVLNTVWVLHDKSLATFEVPNIFGVKDMGILVETVNFLFKLGSTVRISFDLASEKFCVLRALPNSRPEFPGSAMGSGRMKANHPPYFIGLVL